MANRPVKLENGIYRQQLSRASRRRSTQPPRVLKEKELRLVNSTSNSLKRYVLKQNDIDEE